MKRILLLIITIVFNFTIIYSISGQDEVKKTEVDKDKKDDKYKKTGFMDSTELGSKFKHRYNWEIRKDAIDYNSKKPIDNFDSIKDPNIQDKSNCPEKPSKSTNETKSSSKKKSRIDKKYDENWSKWSDIKYKETRSESTSRQNVDTEVTESDDEGEPVEAAEASTEESVEDASQTDEEASEVKTETVPESEGEGEAKAPAEESEKTQESEDAEKKVDKNNREKKENIKKYRTKKDSSDEPVDEEDDGFEKA